MTSSAARDEQCRYRTRPLTMQDVESAELTNMEVDVVVGRTCRVQSRQEEAGSWRVSGCRPQGVSVMHTRTVRQDIHMSSSTP